MIETRPRSTILIVDDDPLICATTAETLHSAGYRVVAAADGAEAWEKIPTVAPDLILSDVRMPKCDGFELLRRVRRDPLLDTKPFIIVSAKGDTSDYRMGMSLGADDYVTKPYQADDLLRTIEVRLAREARQRNALSHQQRFLMRVLPHELRTPLTGIMGYAELLIAMAESGHAPSAADLLDYGRQLRISGDRLLQIARNFSLWAWLESAQTGVAFGLAAPRINFPIDGGRLRKWAVAVAEPMGRKPDLVLDCHHADLLVVREGFELIFSNLVENACKFSLPGTPVRISTADRGSSLSISIADEGRGMSAEEIAEIGCLRQFGRDRFEQQGLGLGLALAMMFSRLSHGNLSVHSNAPKPGLTATLTLQRS